MRLRITRFLGGYNFLLASWSIERDVEIVAIGRNMPYLVAMLQSSSRFNFSADLS